MGGIEIGLFAATLLWLALLVKLTRRWLPEKLLLVVLLAGIVVALLPFNGLLPGGYIFSLTSYLAIPTMLLLLGMLFASVAGQRFDGFWQLWTSRQQWLAICGFFLIAGLFLYPMTAGLTRFDPYRLGYADAPWSVVLVVYLACWALLCASKRWYLLLVLILASVLGYYLKLLPSLNLWDYLMDPLIFFYSLFTLLKTGACRLLKSRASNQQVS